MSVEILQQMHDIAGLDPISCWPLALGWWLILIGITVMILGSVCFFIQRKKYRNSWEYLVYQNLTNLSKTLVQQEKKYIIRELSENMRQIAVRKYPREDCASLTSDAWLHWLDAHDPKKFTWTKHGAALILGPYAPNLDNISNAEIELLINAAKRWVK